MGFARGFDVGFGELAVVSSVGFGFLGIGEGLSSLR